VPGLLQSKNNIEIQLLHGCGVKHHKTNQTNQEFNLKVIFAV
jgi:hypothetical protein